MEETEIPVDLKTEVNERRQELIGTSISRGVVQLCQQKWFLKRVTIIKSLFECVMLWVRVCDHRCDNVLYISASVASVNRVCHCKRMWLMSTVSYCVSYKWCAMCQSVWPVSVVLCCVSVYVASINGVVLYQSVWPMLMISWERCSWLRSLLLLQTLR